ncbi:MAG: shikimate kinase [Candidatus Neomarinimicrobiota bacterium]
MNNIFLIGMMGAGKSTIGKLLSNNMKISFVDTDEEVEKHFNMPINNIFDKYGEEGFREIESLILEKSTDSIVACGGGIVLKKKNRDFIKENGKCLLLLSNINVLADRLSSENNRPLLNDGIIEEQLEQIWEQRKDLYYNLADQVIEINDKSKKQITDYIIGVL